MMENMTEPQKQLLENLEKSGQLGKMKAMVMEATVGVLKGSKPDAFEPSAELRDAKSTPDGLAMLGLLHDALVSLGLQHTASVLTVEAGVDKSALTNRATLSAKFGAPAGNAPVLSSLLSGSPSKTLAAAPLAAKKELSPVKAPASAVAVPSPKKAAADDEVEQDPKAEEDLYFISKYRQKTFVRKGGEINGQQLAIEDLTDCKIYVFDAVDCINMDACVNCELIVAACEGSLFVRDCKNCKVTACCKQLRTRDSEHLDLRLFAFTDPVVETSHHVTFRPFNLALPKHNEMMKLARLNPLQNRYVHVYDFSEDDAKIPQPHYTVFHNDHGLKMEEFGADITGEPVECIGAIRDLLNGNLPPADSSESGGGRSHNIKTGAKAWTAEQEAAAAAASKSAPPPPPDDEENLLARSDEEDRYSSFEEDDEF